MNTFWVPGVNHLGTFGRNEFTEVLQTQADFKAAIDANFNKLIEGFPFCATARMKASDHCLRANSNRVGPGRFNPRPTNHVKPHPHLAYK